ncbi:j-protein (type III) [Saccharomyces pastorianus]|uniref:J protein JJJ2 n=1 Tax=Saccharomyces pastorianus TaxID=27292 RepID=A0A6C1E9A1_SACPS|nr:j-protein (type III) [Saccharomyces pastorianus]
MSQVLEPILDRTTYYSILGLTSNATSSEVHKSYLKLARLLHPDKTNSDKCEELFKAVVHAHSVLTDKEEKLRYDQNLKIKGLHTYQPNKSCHTFKTTIKEPHETSCIPTKSEVHHRQNKPYEQQPYGFGVGKKMNISSKSKVPIFKSFNLKDYQRSHNYSSKKERKHGNPDIDSLFQETNGASKVRMANSNTVDANPEFEEIWETLDKKTSDSESHCEDPDSRLGSVLSDDDGEEFCRVPSNSSSPEEDNKYNEGSKKERRNSSEENREEMRYKQFKLPKVNVFPNLSHQSNFQSPFITHEYRHYARNKFENRNQNRRAVSPIKEIPATLETAEGWTILKDIVEKLNISNTDDRNKDLFFLKNENSNKNYDDTIKIENLSIKESKGIKKRKKDDISLEELSKSLPKEKDFFVMNAVNESLDSIYLPKKPKTAQSQAQSERLSQTEGNQAQRTIPLEKYGMSSKSLSIQIPEVPDFATMTDLKFLNASVQLFNLQCNKIKEELFQASLQRLRADTYFSGTLMEKQNIMTWKTCLEFDRSLMDKLNILQERQMHVVEFFSKIYGGRE